MQSHTFLLSALSLTLITPCVSAHTSNEVRATTPVAASAPTVVPALIPYASVAAAVDGKPLAGDSSMTFLIFKDEAGGQPLWVETQIVSPDSTGQYAVKLGAASPSGVPLEIFATGTARWLEVQIAGQRPQPRVLLATVPYAARAADAATLGGLPASAFVLANSQVAALAPAAPSGVTADATANVTTTGGKTHYLPTFTGASTVLDSEVYDSGKSVGIGGVPSTSAKLDVLGSTILRGSATISYTGSATSTKSYPSYGIDFLSDVYNSSTKKSATPYFEIESEPAGNNTSSPSATLNLRYSGGSSEAETGFYFNPNGTVHFASGQSFPGSVTSVGLSVPSSDFNITSGPVTSNGTLSFAWVVAPNTAIVANSIVKRDGQGGINASVVRANQVDSYGPTYVAGTLTAQGIASFTNAVGVGTTTPQAELNLNAGGRANADTLLLGNTSSKGLQFRDNGTGVDIESIGVPLNVNFVTQKPTYINPNGGQVFVNYNASGAVQDAALVVGDIDYGATGRRSALFSDDVQINGNLFVGGDVYDVIDHPLAPMQKSLAHAAIESSEVLNLYSGNVTSDELGLAIVHLPDWFEAANTDFRYQLTVIGGRFAQAVVSKEVEHNQFTINTNAPLVKVSWQVTARRNDTYTKAHPFVAERDKPARERGTYLHPEVYGQAQAKRTGHAERHP